jgi:uncharacterized protein YdeI (BOF family)
MTIDQLISILNRAKESAGGDTEVQICSSDYCFADSSNVVNVVIQDCKSLMSDEDGNTTLYLVKPYGS